MKKILLLVVCIMFFTACEKVAPKPKLVGDCLMDAISFYAQGGVTFTQKGCIVETSSFTGSCDFTGDYLFGGGSAPQPCAAITAKDVTDTRSRELTARIPTTFLTPEKLPDIEKEFVGFVKTCLEAPSQVERAKNPLLKNNGPPVESPCHTVSLRINDVPGYSVTSSEHVHFSWRSMEVRR